MLKAQSPADAQLGLEVCGVEGDLSHLQEAPSNPQDFKDLLKNICCHQGSAL